MATSRARDARQPDKTQPDKTQAYKESAGSVRRAAAACSPGAARSVVPERLCQGSTRVLAAWSKREEPPGPSSERGEWPGGVNLQALDESVALLRAGAAVVLPTETVYGLAAQAYCPQAVARIFELKQRPADNPLIVHVASEAQLHEWAAEMTPLGRQLAAHFWPGPLTLVVASREARPWVTAGLDSVALRSPAHPFMRQVVLQAGPLAAPSANRSGRPSPTRAEHALEDLGNRVPLVVDGGQLPIGLESTVLDVRSERPVLLRPGAITAERIAALCGQLPERPGGSSAARSPGMKYRHYSPRAELWLYPVDWAEAEPLVARDIAELRRAGKRVGSLCQEAMGATEHRPLPGRAHEAATVLFSRLRELDALGADVIVAQDFDETGMGAALADRLRRAATRLRSRQQQERPSQ